MANVSEDVINSSRGPESQLNYPVCLKEIHFGIVFFYCLASICFLIGTPAHLWCLWFCLCIEQKSKPIQVFFLNHTIMELIFCVEWVAEIIRVVIIRDHQLNRVILFFVSIAWIGRPLIQACICFEQYLAVIHPLTFVRNKDLKFRIGAAASIWLISIGYGLYKTTAAYFPDFIVDTVFFMTVIVISFCCVSVLRALKNPGPGEMTGRNVGNQQKRNAFNIIFLALLIILCSYIPQAFLTLFDEITTDQTMMICDVIPSITSLNLIGVIITPLMKMYKENHLNFCSYCKEIKASS